MTGHDGPPRYTTSIDEALRLLPEGWAWSVVNERERELSGKPAYFADMRQGYRTSYDGTVHAWAATPALALCAAALKAKAMSAQQGQDPQGLGATPASAVANGDLPDISHDRKDSKKGVSRG